MRRIVIALVVSALAAFSSCAQDMSTVEKGERGAVRKVLIAASQSEFKGRVLDKIVEILGVKDYYFKITGLDQLEKEDVGAYGAIVLVSAVTAGRLSGKMMRFLEKHAGDRRIILFYTYGSEASPPKLKTGADAVAGASVMERADERAKELAAFIRQRFPEK